MMRAILRPFRFQVLPRSFREKRPLRVLDVGCGSHSPSITKKWLPGCEYHGVDRARYHNDEEDLRQMDRFFEIDLERSDLHELPDDHYDLVLFSHVIEHLRDGESILQHLAGKLRPGGYLYVETPAPRSLRFPSMPGTLNFYDDPTHVRLYRTDEIARPLRDRGLRIAGVGKRRDWLRVALTPVVFPLRYVFRRDRAAGDLWDLLGFADYVLAQRPA